MKEEQIRIERIKVGELEDFAKSMISSIGQVHLVPITLQRAIAHAHNPYADDDDIGLLVAYIGEECVGYFGILPIMLKHGTQHSKVNWFSTWLVSPNYRGRSIGSLLMKDALSMVQDYMIVGSGPARKVCRKFGFHELPSLFYYTLDMSGMGRLNPITWIFRLFRKILAPIGVKVKVSNKLTKLFENLVTPFSKRIFCWLGYQVERGELEGYSFEEVREIGNHGLDLDECLPDVSFYRGREAINWMLNYPWVSQPDQSPTENMGFYFTDVRDVFSNIAIELHTLDKAEYLGYVVLSYSIIGKQAVLKILDMHFVNEEHIRSVLPLALCYGKKFNVDRIEFPTNVAGRMKSETLRRLLLHKKQRIYQCHPKDEHSPLAQWWQDIELNYCDGDMPFT